jgi:hypothetical protein
MKDLYSHEWMKVGTDGHALFSDLNEALVSCESIQHDLENVDHWAAIFGQPVRLGLVATKNYMLHKKHFYADLNECEEDFKEGKWYAAGIDLADALVTIVGEMK